MKKALIICAAGMSSSLMAKKTTNYLKEQGHDIEVDAISANEGARMIEKQSFDLYLVSPQTKMYFKKLKEAGDKVNKPVVNIPPQAYVPIPMGIEKLASVILQGMEETV
ncbi:MULTISPECIES: PTS cellobiose transporter subunit IIB [Mammaliicoccus]|uniref:PTS cellobiose transporter subunit IIB n=1 Tax=Mammaliicoccus TaxID=2803850 RepID=UPI000DF9336B|nr:MULTISPECIES: PTS cellobiose transporter subunit IIB [Mammaliicoccus]HCN60743.1 PTS cellobiose transporter subunit IIB [Staphylococcus sp.]MBO3063426.1 PTS cellobiose transporter subunit IIB [Mammaliicoccus fleurettii]MBW0765848.1 PTS cellobiose transporter subunit IIB [Mammaliicoccus fleurettii]MDT3994641.1 PTS cellobiose transporter subunit IIB [Mammaliicoccus fleurettii]MEB6202019.1 PTS cellobiose transporter subunit IIB [Mammaliicoccus fleurettii]